MKICKPYTYSIGWSKHKIWYYGVRFSKSSYVGDIWIEYFTSSPLVAEFVKTNGPPDIVKVRRVFETIDDAVSHECNFLRKVKAPSNPNFLNAHYAPAFKKFDNNPMKNEKTKQKMTRTRTLREFIKFITNKTFVAHPRKISRIQKYLKIISNRCRKYPRIERLLERRIKLCEEWKPKSYPKNRKRTKRGKTFKVPYNFGKTCYHDPITKVCKVFGPDDTIPKNWIKGLIKNTPNNNTEEVRKKISKSMKKSRSEESEEKKKQRVDNWRKSKFKEIL